MSEENTSAIGAPADPAIAPFKALHVDIAKLKRRLLNNMGPAGLTEFDLTHIQVPSGDTPAFQLPTPEGKPQLEMSFRAIILGARDGRAYWPSKKAGNTPPQCASRDGVIGVGDPGGRCDVCPLAQFGSDIGEGGERGRGQACKQFKQIVLIRAGESRLPDILNVPPTSLGSFKNYSLRLTTLLDLDLQGVVTEITLSTQKNADGTKYMRLEFNSVEPLPEAAVERVFNYVDEIGGLINPPRRIEAAPAAAQIAQQTANAGLNKAPAQPGEPLKKEAF